MYLHTKKNNLKIAESPWKKNTYHIINCLKKFKTEKILKKDYCLKKSYAVIELLKKMEE